jgi:hypothetical protein
LTGRLRGVAGLAVVLVLAGCKPDAPESSQASEGRSGPAAAPLPKTEADFLAELLPLPTESGAIEIRYAVTGPALEGELTMLVREGGYKRETWELRTTGTPTPLRSTGLTVVNPEHIWTKASVDGPAPSEAAPSKQSPPGQLRSYSLGALARAWAALDSEQRDAVAKAIRDWHGLLDKRRAEVPGDQTRILDVACLQTRVAAQNLCLWEQAGVFLRYEGSAFTIEAEAIDRDPAIPTDAFTLPPEAKSATPTPAAPVDFGRALEQAAAGDFGELFMLTAQIQALPEMSGDGPARAPAR